MEKKKVSKYLRSVLCLVLAGTVLVSTINHSSAVEINNLATEEMQITKRQDQTATSVDQEVIPEDQTTAPTDDQSQEAQTEVLQTESDSTGEVQIPETESLASEIDLIKPAMGIVPYSTMPSSMEVVFMENGKKVEVPAVPAYTDLRSVKYKVLVSDTLAGPYTAEPEERTLDYPSNWQGFFYRDDTKFYKLELVTAVPAGYWLSYSSPAPTYGNVVPPNSVFPNNGTFSFVFNYGEKPVEEEKDIMGIKVAETGEAKKNYVAGESFDPLGYIFTVTYVDNTTKVVTGEELKFTPDPLTAGTTQVWAYYVDVQGVTKLDTYGDPCQVRIKDLVVTAGSSKTLSGIAVSQAPTKTSYVAGQSFSSAGMKVKATYSDSSSAEVTTYTYSPTGALAAGDQSITISYTEGGVTKTTTQAITVAAKAIDSLKLEGVPAKQNYVAGEKFEPSGLTLKAVYNDGSEQIVSAPDYTVSPTVLNVGDVSVTFNYSGKTVTYTGITVTAKIPKLTKIEVTTSPNKTNYVVNQILDLTGMKVTATYDDNSTADITSQCSVVPANGSILAVSDTGISISYTEDSITKTASQPITVVEKAVTGIRLEGTASKKVYTEGESFDPTGLTLYADYNDDTSLVISSGYTITPNPLTEGVTSVTFTYAGKKAAYSGITVNPVPPATLTDLQLTTSPTKTEYIQDELFDPAGMVITAVYSDSSTAVVTDQCTITPDRTLLVEDTQVTVSYTLDGVTKTVTVPITVTAKVAELTAITVTASPDKVAYVEGQVLDLTGLQVTATYDDNSSVVVTDQCVMYPLDGSVLEVSDTKIEISYTHNGITKKTEQLISVEAKAITGIRVEGIANTVTYVAGESFDPTGLTLYADYNDGTAAPVTSGYTITNDPLQAGDTTVTFTYQGHTAIYGSIVVTAVPVTLESISVATAPTKITYIEGQFFAADGMVIMAHYSDGSELDVTTGCTYSPTGALSTGDTAITISYEGKTVSQPITVAAKQLTGITIEGTATQLVYTEGDSFDPAGLTVSAQYDNGESSVLSSSDYTIAPDPLTAGVTSVSIIYAGKSAAYSGITVNPTPAATLSDLQLTTSPTKTEYTQGEMFDPAGMVITAVYSDSSTAVVTDQCTITPDRALLVEDTQVTVSYALDGVTKTVTVAITVTAKVAELTALTVTVPPDKVAYVEGQVLDLTGLQVTATYDDNSSVDVTNQCSIIPSGGSVLGISDTTIAISYTHNGIKKTANQPISVEAKAITGIRIEGIANTVTYLAGESFDPTGLTIYADYNDGTAAPVTSGYTITNDPLQAGDTSVTFTYQGHTAIYGSLVVTAAPVTLESISVATAPTKITYIEGESFAADGMVIMAHYSDGSELDVTAGCIYSPSGALSTGDTVITISYEGKTVSQPITVAAKQLTGITIEGTATQLVYTEGDSFDPTGLTVSAQYDNGESSVLSNSDYTIAPDPLTAGVTSVSITYAGKSAAYSGITVNPTPAATLSDLQLTTSPTKTEYTQGEMFDPAGMVITAVYSDSSTAVVTDQCIITPDRTLLVEDTQVTVSYTSEGVTKKVTIPVTVTAKVAELTAITVTAPPDKVAYVEGQVLDLTGLQVTATYDDNSSVVVTDQCVMNPLEGSVLEVSDTKVEISYTHNGITKTTEQLISVEAKAITGIRVEGIANTVTYVAGESFDPTGLTLYADYNDGTAAPVTSGYTITNDPLQAGDTTVTFTYQGHTAIYGSIVVTAVPVTLESISVATAPTKITYIEGQSFAADGMVIMAHYTDGSELDVTAGCTYSPTGALSTGDTAITISYEGKTVSQPITVAAKQLTGITIEGTATQLVYTEGDSFDPTGLIVSAQYDNGESSVLSSSDYTIAPDPLTAGVTSVSITYAGKSAAYSGITVNPTPAATLSDLQLTTSPTKTEYTQGEMFDPAGMVITAVYSDSSTAVVTDQCTITPDRALLVEDTQVTVSYALDGVTKTVIVPITVTAKVAELTAITVTAPPDKVAYVEGQVLDLTGLQITATYDDNSSVDVTNQCSIIPAGGSVLGVSDTTIAISYTHNGVEKTTNQPITVAAKAITGIRVEGIANTVTYLSGESFDPTGLTIYADYNDGTAAPVTSGYTITNDPLQAGDTSVTFTYQGHTAIYGSLVVTAAPVTMESISVATAPTKITYIEGESFAADGMVIMAHYSDGSELDVTAGCTYSPTGALSTGDTAITISYEGKTVSQPITVAARQPNGLRLDGTPNKVTYIAGQSFDADGMDIYVTYDNGTEVLLNPGEYSISPDPLTEGATSVTIDYQHFTQVVSGLTVVARQVDYLVVTGTADTLVYTEGEAFDPTGLTIKAVYNDYSEETLAAGTYLINPTVLSRGDTKVTFMYGQAIAEYSGITVNPPAPLTLTNLEITTLPTKLAYTEGDSFDSTGMIVTATYSDNSQGDVTNYCMITPDRPLVPADTSVTVSFTVAGETKTATMAITVAPRIAQLTSIALAQAPDTLSYVEGQALDLSGMVVLALYDDNSTRDVTALCSVSPAEGSILSTGDIAIAISYTEDGITKTTSQNLSVAAKAITGIRVEGAANTLLYTEGESFDPTGLTLYADYNDGTSVAITSGYTITNDPLQTGDTSVTFAYEGKTVNYSGIVVTSEPVTLSRIYIATAPQTAYVEGQKFVPDGMVVMAVYSDGSELDVSSSCQYDLKGALSVKDTQIIMTYEGESTNLVINVVAKVVTELIVSGTPKKVSYLEGENFDPTGLTIAAKYNDGELITLNAGDYTIAPTPLTKDTTSVTLSYQGQTSDIGGITVSAEPIKLLSIELTVNPNKMTYQEGEKFDPAGMQVMATYSDGRIVDVTEHCTVIQSTPTLTPDSQVYISFQDGDQVEKVAVAIVVEKAKTEKMLVGLRLEGSTLKKTYHIGEAFDPTGLTVWAIYDDGSEVEIDLNDCIIFPDVLGKDTSKVIISYQKFFAFYTDFEVLDKAVVKDDDQKLNSGTNNGSGTKISGSTNSSSQSSGTKVSSQNNAASNKVVRTGDNQMIWRFVILALCAATVSSYIVLKSRSKQEGKRR